MYSTNKKQKSCCMRVIENAVKKQKRFSPFLFFYVSFLHAVFLLTVVVFLESFWLSLFFSLDCRVCLSFYRIV